MLVHKRKYNLFRLESLFTGSHFNHYNFRLQVTSQIRESTDIPYMYLQLMGVLLFSRTRHRSSECSTDYTACLKVALGNNRVHRLHPGPNVFVIRLIHPIKVACRLYSFFPLTCFFKTYMNYILRERSFCGTFNKYHKSTLRAGCEIFGIKKN